jgi:N-acetyl-anhydromuramyl-L-alanine amidase AmpD
MAMILDIQKRNLPAGQFYTTVTKKVAVFLHFTAGGNIDGAYNEWARTPERVGTSYILGTDGAICEAFSETQWAYHLGLKSEGWTNSHWDQKTIGIEVVNVGPLKRVGEKLYWWPKNWQQSYCGISETAKYKKVALWRSFEYFATFPDVQMEALRALVDGILERNDIPRVMLPVEKRLQFLPEGVGEFRGILTHANVRSDKFDIGPAFNWDVLEAAPVPVLVA